MRSGRLPRPAARPLARAALAGVIAYVAIDVLLAVLRPRYSLLYNAESDYGVGPWSWVMDLNFLLRGALSLAVAGALARPGMVGTGPPGARTRAGLILLSGWAVCSGLLAFFPDDLEGQRVHGSGAVHLALALVAFACVAAGTVLVSASLVSARRGPDPRWPTAAPALLAISVAGVLALLLLGHATGHRHAPGGLYERIFLGLELLWLAVAAARMSVRHVRERGSANMPGLPPNDDSASLLRE